MGGSVDAIEQGYIQNEIAKSAYTHQKQVEESEKIIVGVNKFQVTEINTIPGFKIDDSIRIHQTEKIDLLKSKRTKEEVERCLIEINAAAKDGRNLMPLVIDAVENHATLGEICDVLRLVFGEHK
jgi:methylmalonyl-CoA mutase N-terminal domain/subunit